MLNALSGCLHPKVMIASRFVSFYKALVNSTQFCVRYLARLVDIDLRILRGRTLHYLLVQCSLDRRKRDELSPGLVKKCIKNSEVPAYNKWRA